MSRILKDKTCSVYYLDLIYFLYKIIRIVTPFTLKLYESNLKLINLDALVIHWDFFAYWFGMFPLTYIKDNAISL